MIIRQFTSFWDIIEERVVFIIVNGIANGANYSRMDQVNLWKTAFKKFQLIWSAQVTINIQKKSKSNNFYCAAWVFIFLALQT